jgi:hypothetical protein
MNKNKLLSIFAEEILATVQQELFMLERDFTDEEVEARCRRKIRGILNQAPHTDLTHKRALPPKKK